MRGIDEKTQRKIDAFFDLFEITLEDLSKAKNKAHMDTGKAPNVMYLPAPWGQILGMEIRVGPPESKITLTHEPKVTIVRPKRYDQTSPTPY